MGNPEMPAQETPWVKYSLIGCGVLTLGGVLALTTLDGLVAASCWCRLLWRSPS